MRRSVWLLVGLLVAAGCSKGSDGPDPCTENCEEANLPPVAKIKAPKIVRNGQKVTLDASASTDPEGGTLKFLWIEDEKNAANNFLDGLDLTSSKLTFTADIDGKFTYTVEVKDDQKQTATAKVTVEVSTEYVPPDLKAPVIQGVVINGVTFNLASAASAAVFTTSTATLTIKAFGTDEEDDAAGKPLATLYSANVTGPVSADGRDFEIGKVYKVAEDDDPFWSTQVNVRLEDSDGLTSAWKTIEVRVVPRATALFAPKAAFVDCGAGLDGTGLTPGSPRNALDLGYQTAMANGLSDVFVAAGSTPCKGLQVDFHSIRLWGLFDPADNWRRLTEPMDKVLNRVGSAGRRYALRTTIKDPTAYNLVYTSGSTYSTGFLFLDGFSFELSGWNYYAVSLTTTVTNDTVDIGLYSNEFVGNVTSVTGYVGTVGWVPGGVLIQRNTSTASNGRTLFLRNLFAVDTTDEASVMQAWVDGTSRIKNAGTVYFYSNVFTGSVKNTPAYKCNNYNTTDTKVGFAFCFQNYSTNYFVFTGRNTFWATAATTSSPIVLSAGNGRLVGFGNVFSTIGNTNTLRLTQNGDDANAATKDAYHVYSAFPTDASTIYVAQTQNSSGNVLTLPQYTCLFNNSFSYGGCATTYSAVYANMNFNVDLGGFVSDGAQPWRGYSPTGLDAFAYADVSSTAFTAFAYWDFDGNYGPKDNGSGNGAKYNAGAFEVVP